MYIYIYIYMCIDVCMYIYIYVLFKIHVVLNNTHFVWFGSVVVCCLYVAPYLTFM